MHLEDYKMKNSVFNKQHGIQYQTQGDYRLPCLTLPEQIDHHIGVWGQRRRCYLKFHRRVLYYNLLTACKLNEHLADIDRQADERFFGLVKELAERENVTEALKAENPMEWVSRMNSIRNRAEEIVNCEIIYA